MLQKRLFQILLSPLSLLYGIGVGLRNLLYRYGWMKSVAFDLPIISVGNLSVGGAGKTPHIEYLIRLLREYLEVATLSRGYKRKSKGFRLVQVRSTVEEVGDEPLQFKRKYPDITVSVGESRMLAIPDILSHKPDIQVLLLDDAFQHLAVKPSLNLLLTEYDQPFTRDYLLPSGRLREWRSAYRRADHIIVTKCPPDLTEEEAGKMGEELQPFSWQQLYFSRYEYGAPYYLFNPRYHLNYEEELEVLLISAIARTDYLLQYLEAQVGWVKNLEYEDHHDFSKFDLSNLKRAYDVMDARKKVIVTTEKDAMRLQKHRDYILKNRLPVFVLPVEVRFLFGQGPEFDDMIKGSLLDVKV